MTQPELLALLESEPEKGMRELINRYSALLYKTVYHIVGNSARAQDVEELVSDVFFGVYTSRETIDPEKGGIAAFLITLSKRRAIDFLRKNGKTENLLLPLDDEMIQKGGADTLAEVEEREQRQALLNAVIALGHPESTIIFRKFFYGETYEQIGKKLKMSKNAVNKRYLKALKKLKNEMKGEC